MFKHFRELTQMEYQTTFYHIQTILVAIKLRLNVSTNCLTITTKLGWYFFQAARQDGRTLVVFANNGRNPEPQESTSLATRKHEPCDKKAQAFRPAAQFTVLVGVMTAPINAKIIAQEQP